MEGLVNERSSWVETELARRSDEDGVDGFDLRVSRTIRAQAAERGIAYND